MKPEATALTILSTARARAKMHEFRVAPADFNALPRDPSMLFSLAIGILGDVAAAVADTLEGAGVAPAALPQPLGWGELEEDPQDVLRFASIFFDAYLNAQLDADLDTEFSLLCAAAYYIAGSVGSATVIIRHMAEPDLDLAGGLGHLVYSILKNSFVPIEAPHAHGAVTSELLQVLGGYFSFEAEAGGIAEVCRELREYFHRSGSPRELLYADIAGALCALKLRNAARTILPAASGLEPNLWRPALAKPHFPVELWPAQQRIADAGVFAGRSVVIQMPTSAGKTRATEIIIRSAFLSGRAHLAVIVAPYRSLCHDIRGDLVTAFAGENVRLDEASDAYQFDLSLDALFAEDSVLIVTPEKLLYMLRRAPDLAEQIGLVIYDEGHQFDGMTRGPTYELLLTSLRMLLPTETQIILISAVIGNAPDVAAWLIGDADAVLGAEGLLPTTKSIAFASWQDQRGRLEYMKPEDPAEREYFVPRIIGDVALPLRGKETAQRRFPEKTGGDVGLFLGLHVVRNGSVAIFCGRKDSVTKICSRAVEIVDRGVALEWPIETSDVAEVEKIRALCELELGAGAAATRAAALGIFAHHADTPHGIRLAIEHAMKEGLAKFVACTSTLAQGVNFPLKYLIVTSTRQGGEQILVRDFHNLMGRAGRAGMHTEGSVIFSTPSIYDQRQQFRGQWTWNRAIELLDARNSEPSRSSILALFDAYQQRQPLVQEIPPEWLDLAFADAARIDEVVAAALAAQPNISEREFRRFIEGRARAVQNVAAFLVANMTFAEGEDAAARTGELAANTLAYHLADEETRVRLVEVFRSIGESIAANTDGDQRALIRRSPLPPAAVAELKTWLTENLGTLQTAVQEGRLLAEISPLALRFATSRAIQAISAQDLVPRALQEWVAGRSYAVIFDTLAEAKVRVGRDHVTVEDAVALCESGFGYDVAMIAASVADLTEELDDALYTGASLLQKQIKYGLTDRAAIAFHEAGFADRHVASLLGLVWGNVVDRGGVRAACQEEEIVRAVLAHIPSYFVGVAAELGGWA
ncbi:MAG: DEAD/DEAH box helicase [Mesorhizobium sp.]|uniref:DEAD/DEAH box helicase n=1 Tax=Mesorhizobium sp. TaxID=1871066 RepID=UPI0011F8D116|nr:DEAD/DEAH box helicase [Mesorhizobium sp.]TIR56643.1 MAG: DEAD/DEAH box helicase [Mesorhizobium sp.]